MLNSLNRSLGQNDAYPFALSGAAVEKLRFMHDLIESPHAQLQPPPQVTADPAAGLASTQPDSAPAD